MVLIEYGADLHMEDGDGDTPLSLADSAELKQAMLGETSLASPLLETSQVISGVRRVSFA